MNRKGTSQYIDSTGPEEDALIRGFQWLIAEAQKSGNKGLVAVSLKANLDNIANWSKLAPILSQLRSRGAAKVQGVELQLFTSKDKGVYNWDGPILVIYGGQELLDAVDALLGSAPVLFIPWTENDHTNWIATWNATKLGDELATDRGPEPTSGPVFTALKRLTDSVNLRTGIVHSSDYEEAVRTMETLFHKGAGVTPETIRRQLVRLGWIPKDADDVKELADKIWTGRRPKMSTGRADDALWKYWNETAK